MNDNDDPERLQQFFDVVGEFLVRAVNGSRKVTKVAKDSDEEDDSEEMSSETEDSDSEEEEEDLFAPEKEAIVRGVQLFQENMVQDSCLADGCGLKFAPNWNKSRPHSKSNQYGCARRRYC